MTPNTRGSLLMILAMALFAVEDMFIKWLTATMPTGQILFISGLFGTVFFAIVARVQGRRTLTRAALHPAVSLRNLGEVVGTLAYITALASIPLATVSAVLQAMPLDLGADTTLCAGSSLVLQVPLGFTSAEWSTGASTPAITVSSSGTYAVDAIDANGCAVSDSRTVTVEDCGVVIPNIVSPNGDGSNDSFVIDGKGGVVELLIYDHWGKPRG